MKRLSSIATRRFDLQLVDSEDNTWEFFVELTATYSNGFDYELAALTPNSAQIGAFEKRVMLYSYLTLSSPDRKVNVDHEMTSASENIASLVISHIGLDKVDEYGDDTQEVIADVVRENLKAIVATLATGAGVKVD